MNQGSAREVNKSAIIATRKEANEILAYRNPIEEEKKDEILAEFV